MKKLLSFFVLAFIAITINAQDISNFGKVKLTQVEESKQRLAPLNILFSALKPVSGTEFRIVNTDTDKLGYTHITYQQYYNNRKVVLGQVKVHQRKGKTISYSGSYFPCNTLSLVANVGINQITGTAKQFFNSNEVFWLTEDGISKTNIPQPELVLLPNRRKATLNLAYAIGVGANEPKLSLGILYVDAISGKVLKYNNLLFTCFDNEEDHENDKTTLFASGTGATVYSGSQTIQTTLDNTDYILYDQTRANTGTGHDAGVATKSGIATLNFNHDNTLANYNNSSIVTEFTDGNNNWTAANMSNDEDQYALDAHWGAQVVYDYFSTAYGKDSYDDNDSPIISYVHYDNDYTNAAWVSFVSGRGFMIYGDGGGSFTPLTTLDVAAHEIAHGITNNTSELDYELESGALNEGFSDIWAIVVENYANNNLGTSKDISLINEGNGGGAIRSMSNPNLYGQPDTYGGTNWYDVSSCTPDGTNNDYCGVHTNSGVLNYWFWLLSQGGSGTNDLGDAFSVAATGMDDASAIAYRVQHTYLTSTSDYADARTAAIQSAQDLFGACSSQEAAVTNAWHAVGVGTAFSSSVPTIDSNASNTEVCVGEVVTFTTSASNSESNQWEVNDGTGWANLSDDSTYSGVDGNALMINTVYALDSYQYRNTYTNTCGDTSSNAVTLTVEENPDVTVTVEGETCVGDDGTITFSFPDNSNRSNIEFSINGGSSYPYNYNDNTGSQTLSSLADDTYNIWVRWGNNECPIELGDYVINPETTPIAIFDSSTNETCASNDGSLTFALIDIPSRTEIAFSINNGNSYDHTFDDSSGLGTITDLTAGDYDVWISYNGDCPTSIGQHTVGSDGTDPINAAIEAIDASTGNSDGRLVLSFLDDATQTAIEFSIDGGSNFDYSFDDTLGSEEISSLSANTYNVWARYGDGTCANDLGDFTINESAYTAIPDANFESALNDLGYDNYIGDNKVPTANINTITDLDVDSKSISDVTGIEDFVALTTLSFQSNTVSSIDVSNLTSLTHLSFQYNNISTIDLSNNILLEHIACRNNGMTSLDFSNNPALRNIYSQENSVMAMDLSNNPNLEIVAFPNNNNLTDFNIQNGNNTNVTTFNLTSCPNVSCIIVDDVAYSTTNWTDIDNTASFSNTYCNYTAIPDANFEAALEALGYDDISADGQVPTALIEVVTSLDVQNKSITDVTGIEDFTALEVLYLQDNNLTAIDVSNNTLLKILDTENSPLTTLDVTNNLLLEELYCENNDLTTIDLSNNTALKILDLDENGLTNIDVSQNTALQTLDLSDNTITSLDISNNTSLTFLAFEDNGVNGTLDLRNHTALKILACDGNDLTHLNLQNGVNAAMTYFNAIGNTNLTCILVDDAAYSTTNWTNIDGTTSFSDAYCLYTAIPDANFEAELEALGYDDISADGQVPTALIEVVTSLSLSYQNITDFTGIEDFIALESLTVSYNSFTSLDVSNSPNLTFLNCGYSLLVSLDVSTNTLLETLWVNETPMITLDLSLNTNLTKLTASSMSSLTGLNLQNGNNTNVTQYTTVNTPNLTCILVDDATYSTTNWTDVDTANNFNDTSCDYTLIPDANFEAELEALGYDDISGDGQVPTALIEVVTSLNVSNDGIADLTGIEDFAALVTLNCRQNDLVALDVSQNLLLETLTANANDIVAIDLSNNTALTSVNLGANELTTLDVSNNTALTVLSLQVNSGLTAIDVSNNVLLKEIRTYNANIATLDISNNPALELVYLYSSPLTAIDVSNNPNIEELRVNETSVTELDLSNNPNIDALRINGTGITSLDLSNQVLLEKLFANDTDLTFLNVKNGNNVNVGTFRIEDNPNLSCVLVDDPAYSNTNWTDIDSGLTFSDTYCRYTAIPDANFEAELEAKGYDDISADGQVPTALIEVVTSLNVSNDGITDLTGIEDFTALSILTVSDNALGTINVSNNLLLTELHASASSLTDIDVSNNTLLEKLTAHSNFLTSLDVTANTVLKDINVYGNLIENLDITNNPLLESIDIFQNKLTSLDLSNNASLKQLYINNNDITSLDLTANTVLEELNANDNELTYLDARNGNNTAIANFNATGNSNLTCIRVDDVAYATANWTNIDAGLVFSNTYCRYTAIPDLNFETELFTLGYDDTPGDGQVPTELIEVVTTLDVKEKNIADLTGIEDFIALTSLDVIRNDLTSLDVSNNTLLETLLCQENAVLASLNVDNNPVLTNLVADGNQLTTLDISSCVALEDINISDNPITYVNTNMNTLLEVFTADNTSLEALDFTNNTVLEEIEVTNSSLRSLNVKNGNNVGITDFYATGNANLNCILVDDAIYSTTNWTDIDIQTSFSNTACDYTYVPDDNFEAQLAVYDDVANDNFVPTASIIAVTSLNIRDENIVDLTGIEDFQALTFLNCSKNQLTTLDVSRNTALETLFTGENQLTSIDVANNTALGYLDIGENSFSTLDVSNNTAIYNLDASENSFTTLDVTMLTSLETLSISDNAIATIDVSNNTLLKNFNADNCELTGFDASGLANLESVSIQQNDDIATLNTTGATSLKTLVIRNGKLTAVDISTNVNLEIIFLDGQDITSFDMTNNPLVEILIVGSNPLVTTMDLRNGNTEGITLFQTNGNDLLTCINVDNPAYAYANFTNKDDHTSFGISSCGVYAYVPDDNFEAALDALGYDDISNDNQIPLANINTLTTLDVSGEGIIDLTGIEEFVALTSLNVSSNAIESVDFITNPLISTLNIANNQLVSFDVSANTALTDIDVSKNQLIYFSIQNGTNTNITSFNATENSNLECILVDAAAYSTTNWLNIDLQTAFNETDCTPYTAIPDTNFEAALDALGYDDISNDGQVPTLSINTVESLNVASENISDLTGIEDFVALTTLDCSLNLLTTIDVSNNVNLIDLDADENQFTTIDISNNTLLQDLDLDNCLLESIDLTANTQLVDVDLEGNSLTSIDLANNVALQIIDLETNDLISLDVSNNILLEELDIEDNELATLVLPTSTSLVDLDATNNMLTSIDVSTYVNLDVLDLDENFLEILDVSQNIALTRLKVNDNDLISLSLNNGNNINLGTFDATNNVDLYCIRVDDANYSTANWTAIDAQASFNETSCDFVVLEVDVFLQGALLNPNTGEESLMRDDLRVEGGIYGPTSPYGDGAVISENVGTNDEGANSMVDWIWVELRDATDPTIVIAGQSGVLQRDGNIVDVSDDLATPLTFSDVPVGNYHVVVKHRNHLGIMSANTLVLKQVVTTIDFTDANNQITYGTDAQTTFGMPTDVVAMWAGDANADGTLSYSGGQSDVPSIRSQVFNDPDNSVFGGPPVASYPSEGYYATDVNMDGLTVYSGLVSDVLNVRNGIFNNPSNSVFGGPPTSTYVFIQQLPEGAN